MTQPASFSLPLVPPLPPADMVSRINNSLLALRTCWEGPIAPVSPATGQFWLNSSTGVLKLRVAGAWQVIQSDVGQTVTDLDTAVADGPFRFSSSAANSPFPGNSGSGLTIARSSAVTQMAFAQRANGADRIWTRASLNETATSWSAWVKDITQSDIVGTVSRSGGVPTGAIVESDVLSSGTYHRSADGTQVCHAIRTLTRDSAFQLRTLWTFPRAFINNDYGVSATVRFMSAAPTHTMIAAPRIGTTVTGTQLEMLLPRISGQTDFASGNTAEMDITVNGRWVGP